MKQNKKDSTLLIRLSKDKKDKFKDKCNENNTTQTKAIEKFIDTYNATTVITPSPNTFLVGESCCDIGEVLGRRIYDDSIGKPTNPFIKDNDKE